MTCRPALRRLVGVVGLVVVAALHPATAAAQQPATSSSVAPPTAVSVEPEVGDYSSALGDWPVEAVRVTADLEEGVTFTVALKGTGGQELWTETAQYTEPFVRIPVSGVAVGDLGSVEFNSTLVLGQLIPPELEERLQGGGGSTGQVATSMALVVIIAVILFRTPLPAAASQRWTK